MVVGRNPGTPYGFPAPPGDATPKIQYVRELLTVSGSAKNVRLQKVVYPSGREVYYAYSASGSIGAALNRTESIGSGDANGRYEFLGAGAVAVLDYPGVSGGLGLSYDPNANGLYEGLDRFGRVIDHGWSSGDTILISRLARPGAGR